MDAREKNIFSECPQALASANPVIKITWMMLYMAVKEKSKVITFSKKRGKRMIAIKLDNEHELVPPPGHMFPQIISILRHIGRESSPEGPFHFMYTETETEKRFDWFMDHNNTDVIPQLNYLMQWISKKEEDQIKFENYVQAQAYKARRNIIIAIVALAIGLIVFHSVF